MLVLNRVKPLYKAQNYGYKFGQEEETYNIVAAHGYFERNAHNFPLDLASGEAAPVALAAPQING